MISVENVCKDFKVWHHRNGITGGVKDLFNRKYEMKKAVRNLNFSISKGDIVGFIGPNGA